MVFGGVGGRPRAAEFPFREGPDRRYRLCSKRGLRPRVEGAADGRARRQSDFGRAKHPQLSWLRGVANRDPARRRNQARREGNSGQGLPSRRWPETRAYPAAKPEMGAYEVSAHYAHPGGRPMTPRTAKNGGRESAVEVTPRKQRNVGFAARIDSAAATLVRSGGRPQEPATNRSCTRSRQCDRWSSDAARTPPSHENRDAAVHRRRPRRIDVMVRVTPNAVPH